MLHNAPFLCCLKTAHTDWYFQVRRVIPGLTLRVITHLGGSSDLSSDWPMSVTVHVCPSLSPSLPPSHGTVFRTPTSAAPQRFSGVFLCETAGE